MAVSQQNWIHLFVNVIYLYICILASPFPNVNGMLFESVFNVKRIEFLFHR